MPRSARVMSSDDPSTSAETRKADGSASQLCFRSVIEFVRAIPEWGGAEPAGRIPHDFRRTGCAIS